MGKEGERVAVYKGSLTRDGFPASLAVGVTREGNAQALGPQSRLWYGGRPAVCQDWVR